MIEKWLDRVQGLLDYQKDLQLEIVQCRFTRNDLIQLRMILEACKELLREKFEEVDEC